MVVASFSAHVRKLALWVILLPLSWWHSRCFWR
jgi:hypothetical protein